MALMNAQRSHPGHADINHYFCRALANLSANKDNQVAIMTQGGLMALMNAQRSHPGHANVIDNFCRALANLAINDDNQVTIVTQGGLMALISAQRNHLVHELLNSAFVWALYNIMQSQRAAVEACGGIAVVRAIMQRFPANTAIQTMGKSVVDL